jgi:hypothetical protein
MPSDQTMKFNMIFKRGTTTVNTVVGVRECQMDQLTLDDVTRRFVEMEQFIEKITGLRCHIEQVM